MLLDPQDFIATLKGSFDGCDEVYSSGSCYHLYLILKKVFPSAECYFSYMHDHVITKIDQTFYDINGIVQDTEKYQHIDDCKNYTHETLSSSVFSIYGLNVVPSDNINVWN